MIFFGFPACGEVYSRISKKNMVSIKISSGLKA